MGLFSSGSAETEWPKPPKWVLKALQGQADEQKGDVAASGASAKSSNQLNLISRGVMNTGVASAANRAVDRNVSDAQRRIDTQMEQAKLGYTMPITTLPSNQLVQMLGGLGGLMGQTAAQGGTGSMTNILGGLTSLLGIGSGAGTGAAIGSAIMPGIGTAIGGILGGLTSLLS